MQRRCLGRRWVRHTCSPTQQLHSPRGWGSIIPSAWPPAALLCAHLEREEH